MQVLDDIKNCAWLNESSTVFAATSLPNIVRHVARGFIDFGKPISRSGSMIDSGFQDVLGQAKKMLNDSPFQALHGLRVEQSGDHVMLRGNVESFFLKQQAQETVRTATRGIEMINEVFVGPTRTS